jgi:ribosomal protein L11 methyltransferase
MAKKPAPPGVTRVARLAADEAMARRLSDTLAENLEDQGAVTAAYARADGRWTLEIHFPQSLNETAVRALVALAAGPTLANALVFETVEAKDWVAASLEGLAPVAAGRFVVHGKHDRARVPVNRIGIQIEAALAFGTGHHGTTRGCLLALNGLLKERINRRRVKMTPTPTLPLAGGGRHRGESFLPLKGGGSRWGSTNILDIGTGTGVLAIAAARALRRRVLASDIDPLAVRIARENARLNKVGTMVEVIHAAGLDAAKFLARSPFDIIFANILLNPLKALAPPMARLLAPGGRVILSGLLATHAQAALSAYRAQGLRLERRIPLQEWMTLVMRK